MNDYWKHPEVKTLSMERSELFLSRISASGTLMKRTRSQPKTRHPCRPGTEEKWKAATSKDNLL